MKTQTDVTLRYVLLAAGLLQACAPSPPERAPDLEGTVTWVDLELDRPKMLVEADPSLSVAEAFLTSPLSPKTELEIRTAAILAEAEHGFRRADQSVLKAGQQIRVWDDRRYAHKDSYPGQTVAEAVVITQAHLP